MSCGCGVLDVKFCWKNTKKKKYEANECEIGKAIKLKIERCRLCNTKKTLHLQIGGLENMQIWRRKKKYCLNAQLTMGLGVRTHKRGFEVGSLSFSLCRSEHIAQIPCAPNPHRIPLNHPSVQSAQRRTHTHTHAHPLLGYLKCSTDGDDGDGVLAKEKRARARSCRSLRRSPNLVL